MGAGPGSCTRGRVPRSRGANFRVFNPRCCARRPTPWLLFTRACVRTCVRPTESRHPKFLTPLNLRARLAYSRNRRPKYVFAGHSVSSFPDVFPGVLTRCRYCSRVPRNAVEISVSSTCSKKQVYQVTNARDVKNSKELD